jgi:hypothetical protein
MPISIERGAVRLKPSLRVRLHGRNRLPELALTLSLATTALLFGASVLTPASGNQDRFRSDMDQAQMIEMRSAASPEASMPVRKDVRVIPLNAGAGIDSVSFN